MQSKQHDLITSDRKSCLNGIATFLLTLSIAGFITGGLSACGSGGGGSVAAVAQPGSESGSGQEAPSPGAGAETGTEPEPGATGGAPGYRPAGLNAKTFRVSSRTYAPMNMDAQSLTITFDAAAKTATGTSLISFQQPETSRPVFLLDGTIKSIRLNGESVSYGRVQDPDDQNSLVYIDKEIPKGQTATAEVIYSLASDRVSFSSGGVGFLTDMADTIGRFFEKWGPANFEDDQFALTLHLKVTNSSARHQIFANGSVQQLGENEWSIQYPSYYTSTSIFAHLTNRPLSVNRFVYQGLERAIPVTVYSSDSNLVTQASAQIPRIFKELEADYGPYAHSEFIAYIGESSGGMEFVGATLTSLKSLGHELFHSWFARGVMPAEGRAGWLDEAIASWRDHGYGRASTLLTRSSTNLANFSAFNRSTPTNSYADGRALLGEWDRLLADRGGMKPILRGLFLRYRKSLMTTEEFRNYMNETTGMDLNPYFARYVFGGRDIHLSSVETSIESTSESQDSEAVGVSDSLHPTALTSEELDRLR